MIFFDKEPKKEKTFFFVFVEWWEAPQVKHDTLILAREEAQRLAKKTWKKTYILQCIKSYELQETSYLNKK
jgi:hypothetical protein